MNLNNFFKLSEAANNFGFEYEAHDALQDVKAALFVFNKLIEK